MVPEQMNLARQDASSMRPVAPASQSKIRFARSDFIWYHPAVAQAAQPALAQVV